MKAGDLVTLSSYGRKRGYNKGITMKDPLQFGIVIQVVERAVYPYKVKWTHECNGYHSYSVGHMRRELRYAYR